MSVRVSGSDKRLSLQLPGEGQGWARQGDEMIPADLGGGRVPLGDEYEFLTPQVGAIDPAKLLSEIALDGLDEGDFTLAAGTVDGQEKQIITSFGGNTAPTRVTGAFRQGAASDFDTITFDDGNQGVLLFWSASLAKWCIRRTWGPSDLAPLPTAGGPP